MVTPVLSPTESQELTALRGFLVAVLPPGTPVIQGQVNRVAEPAAEDFVVFWPLRQARLSTNVVSFYDNELTGAITGAVLTVSALAHLAAPLSVGTLLTDGTAGQVAPNTVLGAQFTGPVGGTGTYAVTPSQDLGVETLYAGVRADLTPTEFTVQCDVHGPRGADNARVIEELFRSEYGVDAFAAAEALNGVPLYSVVPLYADEIRQMPFINAESQYENRYTLDLRVQINPIVSTPQDFATAIDATALPVDLVYEP